MRAVVLFTLVSLGLSSFAVAQNPRELKVREDRRKVEAKGFWIYNDLPKAYAVAEETKKPIVLVLRCVPCVECVKLDDELMEEDPAIRPLLQRFVCVRVVGTNGLDLSLFQYDTDQSFAIFFLNADKTIYGRFGTRSHRTEWEGDVSLAGLRHALEGALELHAAYPANKAALAGKRGAPLEVASPEKYPSLAAKYTDKLNYEGNVMASCIHCHQIGDAQRDFYRTKKEAIPEKVLFPYPHPKSIGLILDPNTRATVKEVVADSLASRAGLRAADTIVSLNGQPILSIADAQWVLQQIEPTGGQVAAVVTRGGQQQTLTLALPNEWRRAGDLTWRASSWGVRRMTTGGMVLEPLADDARAAAKIPNGKMALRVKYLGQFGAHAAAKSAGAQKEDVIVEFDGRDDLVREADVFLHGATRRKPGEAVPVVLLRDGKRLEIKLPMQP